MKLYVNNGPVVIPAKGTTTKQVVLVCDENIKSWNKSTCGADWVTMTSDDSDFEEGLYYYYFNINCPYENLGADRYTTWSLEYTKNDNTTGSTRFYIYWEAGNGISNDSNNPIIFNPNGSDIANPRFFYEGIDNWDTIKAQSNSQYFTVTATAGGREESGYSEEYDIETPYVNVTGEDRIGSATFSYTNPSTSVEEKYILRLNQKACPYPFGITNSDGSEIGVVSNINPLKIIRGISFKTPTITLLCNFPYNKGTFKVAADTYNSDIVTVTTNTNGYSDGTIYNLITVKFKENFDVHSRFVDIIASYTTTDGVGHSDTVRLMQNASDGSNIPAQIVCGVGKLNFRWDGTKEMYDNVTINWIGNFTSKTVTPSAEWIRVSSGTFVESASTTNSKWNYSINVEKNETGVARTGNVKFVGITATDSVEFTLTVNQAKKSDLDDYNQPEIPVEGDEYCGPIWKDVEYDFGGNEMVEYGIYTTTTIRLPGNAVETIDVLLFAGRSYMRPNEYSNKILVNKICQSYMDSPLLTKDALAVGGGYKDFKLKSADGKTTYRSYKFVNDWSYTDDFATGLLSRPIINDRTVYKNQLLPFTVFGAAEKVEVVYGINYKDGTTDDYGNAVPNYTNVVSIKNGVETEIFPYTGRTTGAESYVINDVVYPIGNDCGVQYVLYYVNPWGGYDWFPIKGKVIEKDSMKQLTYRQNYNNTTWDFGMRKYLTEINKKFELNTHWLTEEESSRMWYLLQSNVVYLHNLAEDKIQPVIITNTEQEHKKRGLRSSRISYTIEVELSQTRQRI
jgi:hypothetical protein